MGEIGIPRREFLYDLRFWEVRSIVRGYRNRDTLKHQLMALCAYNTMYAMRDPKGKTVRDIFPQLFQDDDDDDYGDDLTEEDCKELQDLMNNVKF